MLAVLLFSGCDNDRADTGETSPSPSASAQSASAALAAPDGSGGGAAQDPLLSGAGALGGGGPDDDPLLKSDPLTHKHGQSDPLLRQNPLIGDDPLKGRAMPTEHSHWLNTEFNQANLTLLLNGRRLSSYQQSGTQDITMKLHPGPNTLTVMYTPQNEHSWGSVTVTEGEHEGQALLLAQFQKAPLSDTPVSSPEDGLTTTTQTFQFTAN